MAQFGETVKGYEIPVLNEREVRASAGILLAYIIISVMFAILKQNFVPLKYFIVIFLVDFIIRLFVSPRYAPTLILGRLIVRNQNPEYVGAPQKKFAWYIGLTLAVTMFILSIVMNSFSMITGLICLFCQIFLLFESAFGICLGCIVYHWIYKEKAKYCPGEVCEVNMKQDIQKTSMLQVFILIGFIAFVIAVGILFNSYFVVPSHSLF